MCHQYKYVIEISPMRLVLLRFMEYKHMIFQLLSFKS
ncbi:hypothetical protein OH686_02575 [Pseudomonas sp. SO81]|nr:hypothetical protein OH686_02575 [Pseudomonas sp. SO81]